MSRVINLGKSPSSIVYAARENRRALTQAEKVLWEALRGRQVGGLKFRKQHPAAQYVLDFFCAEEMLAVEVDGDIHDDPEQKELDQTRTQYLQSIGIRVIRFDNEAVLTKLGDVLDQIERFVRENPLRSY